MQSAKSMKVGVKTKYEDRVIITRSLPSCLVSQLDKWLAEQKAALTPLQPEYRVKRKPKKNAQTPPEDF